MPMVSIAATSPDGVKKSQWFWYGCYASWFSQYRSEASKEVDRYFHSLFGIDTAVLTDRPIKSANFFLHKLMIPAMPDRMREAITFRRIFNKVEPATFHHWKIKPWLEVTADTTKVTADDLFQLLVFLRFAQEHTAELKEFFIIHKRYPQLSLDNCFLLACVKGHRNDGAHKPFYNYHFAQAEQEGMCTREALLKWTLKEQWTTRFKQTQSYYESRGRKTGSVGALFGHMGQKKGPDDWDQPAWSSVNPRPCYDVFLERMLG